MDIFRYEIDHDGVISCFFDLEKARGTYSQISFERRNEMTERGALIGEEQFSIMEIVPYEEGYYILPHSDLFLISRTDKCTKNTLKIENDGERESQKRRQRDIDKNGFYLFYSHSFPTKYDFDVPGCIVFYCEKNKDLRDNDLLFKVFPKNLANGYYPSNDIYKQQPLREFTNDILYPTRNIIPTEWFFKTGDYVKADDVVCRAVKRDGTVAYEYKALKDGFIEIVKGSKILFAVYSNESLFLEEKGYFQYEPLVKTDSFTNELTVAWKSVSRYKEVFWMYADNNSIKTTFQYREGKSFLVIHYGNYSFKLKVHKGDVFSFLFEDDTILDFKIEETPYKLDSAKDVREVKFPLYQEDVEKFQHLKIKHWKFSQTKMAKESVTGILWDNEVDAKYMALAFQRYMESFIGVLSAEIPNYSFPKKEVEQTSRVSDDNQVNIMFEPCYVYLMKDTANGYSKIGISNKPSYREHTLQSEKPTIELVCAKQFPSRKIALAIESALHTTYDDKHVRGEWFNLDGFDIEEIKQTLK